MSKPVLYIDGESGTTGLEIRKRLAGRSDIEFVSIAPEKRKDADERKRLLNACDVAILCLPDEAAKEAVSMIDNPTVRVLDASTAYRTAPEWAYGFPELNAAQADAIRKAKRVSNPGCYPTGAIALLRPLIERNLMPDDYRVTVNAVSGYSGGGKDLIAICENPETKGRGRGSPYCLYGLDMKHKHVPEMRVHTGLKHDPIFLPVYSGAFYRGMLIHIALRLDDLSDAVGRDVTGADIHAAYAKHYEGQKYVWVEDLHQGPPQDGVLTPLEQADTNNLQLHVFWNAGKHQAVVTACLDNLGKGASGAAVQNLELMLGLSA
ncbi:MAG: N-acetyl-gamma-glutamyl-phosphate reductase [Alphaproteobacteria bacterium]|nr:N-acetyl-gamma-glutamyl-phosphate reductase [Alphaproteobacteria bacterium]MBV8548690.1 N-acetyl-gamma-glutamyl-phosphate reductase [Alphaproteobacteria bacterium]